MNFKALLSISIMAGAASGCVNLAPATPEADSVVPDVFSVAESAPETSALYEWDEVILDDTLRHLIETALSENRDLRAAVANIRLARATANATSAARLPTVAASASATVGDTFESPGTLAAASAFGDSNRAALGLTSYEIDLFGRIQNQSDAAYQSYLASVEDARAVQISIISSIAEAWLTLAADKQLLLLAESTVESQSKSLALSTELFEAGVTTELAKRQASASVETARAQAAQFRALVQQDINAIELLIGKRLPADVYEQAQLNPIPVKLTRPVGQDSSILLSRPDIRSAERSLAATSANIGAARAAYFPSISLTSSAGYVSTDLGDLIDPSSGGWSFGPSISLPIFDGGRRKSNLEAARARQDLVLAQYEKAIQSAFKDVSDALAVSETIDERLEALTHLTDDTSVTFQLSEERFKVGVDNYLSVLDAQRSDYAARQQLIAAQLTQGLNVVAFYRALGGAPSNSSIE